MVLGVGGGIAAYKVVELLRLLTGVSGSVELDRLARRCRVNGREVDLTRREFDLLAALMQKPDRVRSREELLQLAWGSTFLSEKTVDVHVAALRRKLGDAVSIAALRGVGYRLES